MTLRVIVADDEPHALRLLGDLLEEEPEVDVLARCRHGGEALRAIREHDPDVAFLDVRMPELDGFEVVDALGPEERPRVVFVTAYDEHALRAFEVHALAYLVKPFDRERLRETVRHVRELLAGTEEDEAARMRALLDRFLPGSRAPRHLVVRGEKRSRLVPVGSIDWIEASGSYARLHCGDATHLVSRSLTDLEETLREAGFARIHRSTVVNLDRVAEFRTLDGRDFTVVLEDGQRLRLSRTYRSEVEERLGDRI